LPWFYIYFFGWLILIKGLTDFQDYLEYNSTINCSLIFSVISSREGAFKNLAAILLPSHSIQAYLFVLEATASEIEESDFDFSRTPITSPARNV